MKYRWLAALGAPAFGGALPATLLTVLLGTAACPGQTQTILSEDFSSVLWGPSALSSPFGQFTINLSSPGGISAGRFVNVVRDDGTWVVQNMLVGFEPGTRQMATGFTASLFDSSRSYQTSISATSSLLAPTFSGGTALAMGAPVNYQAHNLNGRSGDGTLGAPALPTPPTVQPPDSPTPGKWSYHVGVPDIEQTTSGCVPTSAADSLLWLAKANNLNLPGSPTDLRDEMYQDMQTTIDGGTKNSKIVAGKDAFVKAHNLPIVTSLVADDTTPKISDLFARMKQGQDIELGFAWLNADGSANGGHCVDLVGISLTGDPQNPTGATISYNDPDDGKDQTVTNPLIFNPDGTISIGNAPKNRLDLAVTESMTPEPGAVGWFVAGATSLLLLKRSRFRKARPHPEIERL